MKDIADNVPPGLEARGETTARSKRTLKRKVFVIGLDCVEPRLVFDQWRDDLPTLRQLMEQGVYGRLRSSEPPITVPAWSSMLTARDPGELGFYGFRNRADYSYNQMRIATSLAVKHPRVWDVLGRHGFQSVIVGVPQTYPVRPVNGWLVSSFLTPPGARQWTYPASLAEEIEDVLGGEEYEFDVRNFRTENKQRLLDDLYRMTEKRFKVLHYLLDKPWDFFMFVEMGTDRIHHGFWKFMDPEHRKYVPGNPFENAIKEYYVYLDREIARLLDRLDQDTVVLVISDHGAKRMEGGFAINEWLIQEGYLVLKEYPERMVPLEKVEIDWSRTKAWGSGGYYARVHLNVKGREPQGIIDPADYEKERDILKAKLEATVDERGQPLGTIARKPEEIYREINNIPPDLIVYFGNLYWRSVGSVGLGRIHTFENDTGPDDANHDWDGIFIAWDPRERWGGRELTNLQLEQVAPTILQLMGIAPEEIAPRCTPIPLN